MKKWVIKEADTTAAAALSKETGLCGLVTHVLTARGIYNKEQADIFFQGGEMSDPFLISDMDIACNVIKKALNNGDKITVFGDYDCDGVTSTVMLYSYITAVGGEVDWYIPSREEGYGLNIPAIDKICESGTKLIITVDNGISAVKEAEYIKECGISLIITDHHQVPPYLPKADAIINPHREGDISPFKKFAGCGVVLKLITALEGGDSDGVMERFADLAAIGTIGDIVPLTGENRIITERGLEVMRCTENIGLYQLLRQCGFIDDPARLTATALAFTICPRINAAGRFAHAGKAAELFLCENREIASSLASELSKLNTDRRQAEGEIMADADKYFSENPERLYGRVLAAVGKNWHHGIIGIIGSRLLSKWEKPVLVISIEGETARGSARSAGGFSLYDMLCHCKDRLIKFGGHANAAGFSLKTEDIPMFLEEVELYAKNHFPVMPVMEIHIDKELEPSELTLQNTEQLALLAPFGEENPSPVFLMKNAVLLSKKPLKDGKYVSFNVGFGENLKQQKILHFGQTYSDFKYNEGDRLDILVSLDVNEYNDIKSVSAQVKDIRLSGFPEDKYFAAKNTYEALKRGEKTDKKLLGRIIPEKEQIKIVYDIIRELCKGGETGIDSVCRPAIGNGLNYCLTSVILDVLEEFKLIKKDIINNTLSILPVSEKADLSKSKVLMTLKNLAQD